LGTSATGSKPVGPELRQYIVTDNNEERPFSRDQRRWIYASAKRENNYFGFGSDNEMELFAGERLHEIQQLVGVPECAVPRRADAIAIHRDTAYRGDLRRDLRLRQEPAHARLRALTQLDLDRTNLRRPGDRSFQPRHTETPIGLATSEIARPNLPHEIAAV
jgi:hypothetical protein